MRFAGPVRKTLGIRTVFNVLGPLTNPASAPCQLLGVFSKELVEPIARVLARLGSQAAWVVHGRDGVDEITVSAPTDVAIWNGEDVRLEVIDPQALGVSPCAPEELRGGTAAENAATMRRLLAGEDDFRPALRDAVALNAGAALCVAGVAADLEAGFEAARAQLGSGAALVSLDGFVAATVAD